MIIIKIGRLQGKIDMDGEIDTLSFKRSGLFLKLTVSDKMIIFIVIIYIFMKVIMM